MNQQHPTPEFIDRRGRLVLLGALALLAAGACALLALGLLFLPALQRALPESARVPVDLRSVLVNSFLVASVAAALAWLGIGSLRARRWVRPLMLTLAWMWLLTGVAVVVLVAAMLDSLIEVSAPEAGPEVRGILRVFLVAGTVLVSLVFPAVLIWGYRDPHVRRTCEAADPAPSWTDRCPPMVLATSLGLAVGAYLAVPLAAYAVAPVFGRLWTGWPAVALTLLGGGACALLARSAYRCERAGWWGATILFVVLGVSCAWTFLLVDTIELYRAIGYPEEQLELLRRYGTVPPALNAGLTVVLTVGCVAFMLRIRHDFHAAAAAPRGTGPGAGRG